MRTKLHQGSKIHLDCDGSTREYIVDSVIGDGASCIAYEAHRTDAYGATVHSRIKECYPFGARIERIRSALVWEDINEKTAAFERFRNSHIIMAQLKSSEAVGNNLPAEELLEGNGTIYSVMDVNHAVTYDAVSGESLVEMLDIALVLTKVVGKLHQQGYLHLDIKPANFLVCSEPNTWIWLFDVDSFTSMSELRSGRTVSVSCSKQWAAPEQLCGRIGKLCPSTDFFAIGAVLFSRVMGRPIANEDMSIFADWEFEGDLFENINPKVKRCLRDIFRKTLSASAKRRYQTAVELMAALEKAKTAAAEKLYIVPRPRTITTHFIGREGELRQIHQAFQSSSRAVFLRGVGGIGKSTLAAAYGNRYERDYDAVIFMRYRNSLEQLLNDIDIKNFDTPEDDADAKLRQLRRMLDERTLIIVDNFDVNTDADDFLDEFLQLKAHKIFTTRTDFSTACSGSVAHIEVGTLPYSDLEKLFCRFSGLNNLSEQDRTALEQLLKSVGCHTYVTELLGRQVSASGYTISELCGKVSHGLSGLSAAEKVKSQKDGRTKGDTIPGIIRALFRISDLSEARKQVLRNIYMLEFLHIDKKSYRELASEPNLSNLNDMAELGWVLYDGLLYSLHPLVEELVRNDLNSCEETCPAVYRYINAKISMCRNCIADTDADEYEFSNNCDFLCAFFCHTDFRVKSNLKLAIEWLLGINDNAYVTLGSPEHPRFRKLYEKLLEHARLTYATPIEIFQIRYIVFAAWVYEFRLIYNGGSEYNIRKNETRDKNLYESFDAVINAVKALPAGEAEEAYDMVFYAITNFILTHSTTLPRDFVIQAYLRRPKSFADMDVFTKYWVGIPLSPAEKRDLEEESREALRDVRSASPADERLSQWSNRIEELETEFMHADNMSLVAKQVFEDPTLKIYQKAALLSDFCDSLFRPLFYWGQLGGETQVQKANWADVRAILDMRARLLDSEEWCEDYDGYDLFNDEFYVSNEGTPLGSFGEDLTRDRAVFAVMTSDLSTFRKLMGEDHNLVLSPFDKTPSFGMNLNNIASACLNIGKCHYVLPYMVTAVESCPPDPDDYDGERAYIEVYLQVADFAKNAMEEVGEQDERYAEFETIHNTYAERIDEIVGKRYSLKDDTEDSADTKLNEEPR